MDAPSFRAQVAEDFKNVFLNVEEFGRICDWNGAPLQIVEGASPPMIESVNSPGTLLAAKEVYCRLEDMPRGPMPNEAVRLDGETWYVIDSRALFGHRIIQLGRHSS